MIKVSETAKQLVNLLMTEEGFDAAKDFVRVGVKSGGCSGLSYELKFDNKVDEADKVFEDNAVRIIVDKKSFLYLVGTTLQCGVAVWCTHGGRGKEHSPALPAWATWC